MKISFDFFQKNLVQICKLFENIRTIVSTLPIFSVRSKIYKRRQRTAATPLSNLHFIRLFIVSHWPFGRILALDLLTNVGAATRSPHRVPFSLQQQQQVTNQAKLYKHKQHARSIKQCVYYRCCWRPCKTCGPEDCVVVGRVQHYSRELRQN